MRGQAVRILLAVILVFTMVACKPRDDEEKPKPLLTYFNAQKLYKTCKNYNQETDDWAVEDELSSKICLGYVAGMMDSTNTILDSCIGKYLKNVNVQTFIKIFNNFVRSNPQYLNNRASDVMVLAINKAYAKEIEGCKR